MAKKRHLYQSSHLFKTHPFEALYSGSWQPVEFIRIEDGIMLIYLSDGQYISGERGPFANLRIRSREANLYDCAFLRPGIDICVLSAPKRTENSNDENLEPVWVDAKISSIERKPHDFECACQFYINLYINQGPLGSEKGELSDDTETVGIDQIFILQKVERNPCENEYYRWGSSEDCSSLPRTKLFLGKFLSDLSWLLVTSVLKQILFEVKSVQNRIVYQVLGANDESYSLNSANRSNAVNFRQEDGITVSRVVPVSPTDTLEATPTCEESNDLEPYMYSCGMELRRSKRRNVQPERFLGIEGFPESDYKPMTYKTDKWNEDEMLLPLSYMFGMHKSSEEHTARERDALPHKIGSYEGKIGSYEGKIDSYEDFFDYKGKAKSKSKLVKSGETTQWENQNQNQNQNKNQNQNQLAIVPLAACEPIAVDRLHLHSKFPLNLSQGNGSTSSRYYGINSSLSSQKKHFASKAQRKNIFDLDSLDFGSSRWERKASERKNQRRSFQSMYSRRDSFLQSRSHNHRSLATGAYAELINSYMKNIGSKFKKEAPNVIDQWKEFHATSSSQQKKEEEVEPSSVEDEGEVSETEMLWKEMELSLASTYLEENEDSNAGVSTETPKKSSRSCQHDFKLEEEIGILCRLCGFVRTEIKYVAAPFMEHAGSVLENKLFNREVPGLQPDDDDDEDLEPFGGHTSSDATVLDDNDNVWALIPELRRKLHFHQRKAFEFLWRNVAGSLVPALMKPTSKKRGGCVISHSPGAGKTFLIIAFLVSYLKLFPGQRPLVLAPKTTLYTWYKEFIKWKIPIPVSLIHGRRTYRVVRQNSRAFPGPKPGTDVMHVLDCLEKIQNWHSQPSVLVMGYTSFLSLMREDSKFSHRRYMARVLRESPGMLILDEGHNPRSTKSRLRKVLMKVETELRILLSGTLFQNNFCEYFNTLCLARPKFIKEVLKVLDPKYKKKKFTGKARKFSEARARKFFIDNIARKIDSSEGEDRLRGLNMLRNITNGFIDVYEGGGSDTLPGLQIYTLLMNSTDVQHEVLVKLHKIMATFTGYPLELELLITLGSIHPWLIKTSHCVNKFFNAEELKELQKCKFDLRKGSKVKFVMNLVNRVVYKEKILIFCHNIAPIHLFLELFEQVYKWRKGREILVLTGDLELFERGRVMDQFEEPGGTSRILLASITACAEGISLTAASRVILLDSEWNPSKTKQAIARAFRPGQQKMVYVYQLLATGTLEEDKYRRTTWKEWVSSMIFSEDFVEDPSCWQAEKVGDDILRELVAEDRTKSFHMIMKNEKASTN